MVVDSGAKVHLVSPLHLDTAGGDLTLDTVGDLPCGGIVCHGCVFNPLLYITLFSTARGEKDRYFCERRREGERVLKYKRKCENRTLWWTGLPRRRRGTMRFTRSAHTSGDGSFCRIDNVDNRTLARGTSGI